MTKYAACWSCGDHFIIPIGVAENSGRATFCPECLGIEKGAGDE